MYSDFINENMYFKNSLKFLQASNYNTAIKYIDKAINTSENKSFYKFQKIKILYVAKMYDECSNYIESQLTDLYKNSSLHIFCQIVHYFKESTNCSANDLEILLNKNGIPFVLASDFNLFIKKANLNLLQQVVYLKENNDYSRCIGYCDLVLDKDHFNITCYLIKARCYYLLEYYDLAISTYEKVLIIEPDTSSIYNEFATILMDLKQYPKAITALESALELEPSDYYLINQLAECYYLWKKYDSALIYFKKNLRKNPNCTETLLRIANLYEETNKPKKAKKYYKKCHQSIVS